MSKIFLILYMTLTVDVIICTIDMNLAELRYLADHLTKEECRRLVAALHFKSYSKPNALDQAEAKVSKDIPCIRLLLHWNSSAGEGKGETHEPVQHRLRQIGRSDLADWLGKTVFHELGKEMEEQLNDPFKELLNSSERQHDTILPVLVSPSKNWNVTEWVAFDTICWVLVIGLSLFTLIVLCKVLCMLLTKKKLKRRHVLNKLECADIRDLSVNRFLGGVGSKSYIQLEEMEDGMLSESEDKFDIRNYDHAAIKLMDFS